MTVTVYGASDDLIEIEGAIREEFTYENEADGDLIALSEGTVLRVRYDRDGVWRITPVATGQAVVTITPAVSGDDDNYSDRAEVAGDVRWVVHADVIAVSAASSPAPTPAPETD